MAFPTSVNNQITDAVSQSNLQVLGDAPSVAIAIVYQSTALALSLAAQNATAAQQQANILAQAVTASCVSVLGNNQASVPVKGL